METFVNPIPMVEKEVIPSLRFGHDDVLTDPEARKKRIWDLNRAASLGNVYRGKVEITFQTADGEQRRVDTTVWAVDDKYMTLKAGCSIPVSSIIGIEFF
ncbi:hypothetical protein POKO110462_06145 [Pontibacter korlensis]|uniref:Uncharacterized protein n=1 Tax=Pontibacter korlensis TaxID=400092 RepID=A0A0E3ZGM5_9BACT|nr:hypothetical protein [Pontibacter korlensis]AKD03514.1 hypothetical protein PKOR_10710 [Pontibacter korlensis]